MFVAIYEFKVRPDSIEVFTTAWHELTRMIYEHENSLGSRLHRSSIPGIFIGYAQWPDRMTWENSGRRLPREAVDVRAQMRAACDSIRTLHELQVTDDLLATEAFGSD